MGQFHCDFALSLKEEEELEEDDKTKITNIVSTKMIALGKKSYIDIL